MSCRSAKDEEPLADSARRLRAAVAFLRSDDLAAIGGTHTRSADVVAAAVRVAAGAADGSVVLIDRVVASSPSEERAGRAGPWPSRYRSRHLRPLLPLSPPPPPPF